MAGERNFLRVPPDSTGKRVKMKHTAQVFYSGKSTSQAPNYVWSVGEFYTISGFGLVHIHGAQELTNDTGILEVHYNKSAVYNGTDPAIGSNIISDDGTTVIAQVSSFNDVYINSNHIVGYDNPEYGVDVDATGSLNVRFAEGLPQLDAFGKLRTSGKTILGDYIFSTSVLPQAFSTKNWGRIAPGSDPSVNTIAKIDLNRRCLELSTPARTSTEIGNNNQVYVEHTSNTYHHYFPGSSHLAIMTVALSNSGEAGVMKEWGYFDDDNGYFFRANGAQSSTPGDNFEMVIRSSADGNLRETRIGRNYTKTFLWVTDEWVEQTSTVDGWNGDPLDGQGDSGRTINLVDDTIYWVDIQWLGAGRVRYGTYVQGQRVVIHEHYNDTNGGFPHSQFGSLPLSFRQYNVLNATVSNVSSMRVWCASVASETTLDLKGLGRGQLETFTATFDPANLNDWKGTNDIGKGQTTGVYANRVGLTITGVTGSTTTLTVPSTAIVGPGNIIKPGYRLHMENANGGGSIAEDTEVIEIVNSTTIIVDQAPTAPLTGVESIRFHLHVSEEYNIIGILSPRQYIKDIDPTGLHLNRTIYTPQNMEAMAYHENGDPAFIEIEVYVDPTISGNDKAVTLESSDGGVLTEIEPDDPTCAVVSYKENGMVNFFGGGYHQLATYFKGNAPRTELGGSSGNLQDGAFKLKAAGGGNNRCPISHVYQSPAAGLPTVIRIATDVVFANGGPSFSLHREGNPIVFEAIPGDIGTALNGTGPYYLRMISQDRAELYNDINFTSPVDTSAVSTAGNSGSLTWKPASVPTGGFIVSGSGADLYFVIVAKPVGPSIANGVNTYGSTTGNTLNRDITVHFILNWNEIQQ